MDQGPYRATATLDPRVEQRRAQLRKPLESAATRMAAYLGVLVMSSLGALFGGVPTLSPILVAATFVLFPTLALVLRSRRAALRFMRDAPALLSFVDDRGLVLLSPDGLYREGMGLVTFGTRVGKEGSLARVVQNVEKHSITMVVLWKPPRDAMREREIEVTLPSSISAAQAATASEQLAQLRGCPFTTS